MTTTNAPSILGRARTVVVDGHAVCLDALEAAVCASSGVDAAAMEMEADTEQGKVLVAYVAMDDERPSAARSIRSVLLDALPSCDVALRIVALRALPTTADGGVDRSALASATGDRFDFMRPFSAPQTADQQALERIWRAVFNMDRVGIDDEFFDIGGDSLAAAQIVSRVADQLGVRTSVERLFEQSTIRAFAETLRRG